MKMPSLKQTILLVGTPAILVGGGLTAMAASAATPTATPSAHSQPVAEPAETADSANGTPQSATEPANATGESADPNEAARPGGGHVDPAGQTVDHQFEGVE